MLHSNQIGGWSTDGLTVDTMHSNRTSVTCLTRHLTSFAVLVNVQNENSVRIVYILVHSLIVAQFSHQQLTKHCQ